LELDVSWCFIRQKIKKNEHSLTHLTRNVYSRYRQNKNSIRVIRIGYK
jgi:hypothetical protein